MSLSVKLLDLATDTGDAFWNLKSLIRILQFSIVEAWSLQKWTLLSDQQRETISCKNRNRKYKLLYLFFFCWSVFAGVTEVSSRGH